MKLQSIRITTQDREVFKYCTWSPFWVYYVMNVFEVVKWIGLSPPSSPSLWHYVSFYWMTVLVQFDISKLLHFLIPYFRVSEGYFSILPTVFSDQLKLSFMNHWAFTLFIRILQLDLLQLESCSIFLSWTIRKESTYIRYEPWFLDSLIPWFLDSLIPWFLDSLKSMPKPVITLTPFYKSLIEIWIEFKTCLRTKHADNFCNVRQQIRWGNMWIKHKGKKLTV